MALLPETEAVQSVADSSNEFALALYDLIRRRAGAANLFFSPASLSTALAMVHAGARGSTAAELRDALRWKLDDEQLHPAMGKLSAALRSKKDGVTLAIANALWGQRGAPFHEEFLALVGRHYGAGLEQVDFRGAPDRAARTISDWVAEQTNGMIPDLLSAGDISPEMVLLLTNAIHFKGTWQFRFDKRETRRESFHVAPDREVDVDMMRLPETYLPYLGKDDFQLLDLPYSGGEVSMTLFLPSEQSSLAELEKTLTPQNLRSWLTARHAFPVARVEIPRFEITDRMLLADELGRSGIALAFSPRADFSGISPLKPLFIADVVHRAMVQVDEEGTRAAAATGAMLLGTSVQLEEIVFRADRPFLFMIRENKTGMILFIGRLVNP